MAEQIECRNQEVEIRKVFRIYDDDDNGIISAENLLRCANDLMETVTEDEIEMMLEMGDRNKKGGVDLEDFVALMKNTGLIPEKENEDPEKVSQVINETEKLKWIKITLVF